MSIDSLLGYLEIINAADSIKNSRLMWSKLQPVFESGFVNFVSDPVMFQSENLHRFYYQLLAVRDIEIKVAIMVCCVKKLCVSGYENKMRVFFVAASTVFEMMSPDLEQKESVHSLFLRINIRLDRECPSVYDYPEARKALFMADFTSPDCARHLAQRRCFYALSAFLACSNVLPHQERLISGAPSWGQVEQYVSYEDEFPAYLYAVLGCRYADDSLINSHYGYRMCLFLLARLWQYCAAGEGGELTEYIERGVNLYMSFLVCHKENNCQAYPVLDFLVNFPVALAYGCSLGADLSALGQLDVSFLFNHPAREALSSEKLGGLIDYQARIDLKIKESRRSRGLDDFVIVGVPMPLSTSFSSALSASFGFFEITPFVHKVAAIDYLMQQNPELGDTAILVDDRAHEFKRTLSGREGYRVNETSVPFKVCLSSKNTIQVWLPDLFQQEGVNYIKRYLSPDRRSTVFFDIDETMEIEAVSTGPVTQDTLVDVREQGLRVFLITNAVGSRCDRIQPFLDQCRSLVLNATQALPGQVDVRPPTRPASAEFKFFAAEGSGSKGGSSSARPPRAVERRSPSSVAGCCVMS